ncbi:MAG: PKD domain-containing protein, partial [Methanobacteriota archaeon]
MRLFRIIILLLVAVVLFSIAPGMGEVLVDSESGGSPGTCSPTIGGACIIADFIASPTSGDAPLRVQFLDTSSGNPSMWAWDFGDGGSSSAVADPVHIYTAPGRYSVRLVASSLTGGSSTKVKEVYITVRDATRIYADFVGSPVAGIAPLSVEFSDCSIGNPNRWLWDFGDGFTDSVNNPTHVYRSPGKYTVKLTASNDLGDSSTKIKEDYIRVDPSCEIIADFNFSPSSGFAPLTVTFTDQSSGGPTMWSWDFGDGSTDMVASPTHTFTKAGTFTVKLTASSQMCGSVTQEKVITVSPCIIDANFVGVPTTGPGPLTVKFTDLSTGNPTMWNWDFGDGVIPMESCSGDGCNNIASPVHTYLNPGTYTVTLTASNQNGCSDTEMKVNYIVVVPACSISADFVGVPTTGPGPLTVKFTDLSTGNPTMWN